MSWLYTPTIFSMKKLIAYTTAIALFFTACSSSKKQQGRNDTADMDALQQKRWVLTRLADTTFKAPAREIYFQFRDNNTHINGFAGCNGFSGDVSVAARKISFSGLIATKMYCDNMPLENRLMNALQQANGYLLNGETLQLLRDDKPLAWFAATYLNKS